MDFEKGRAAMTYNRSTGAYDIKSENTYEKIETNGETFDIGNASEAECSELFNNLNQMLGGLSEY